MLREEFTLNTLRSPLLPIPTKPAPVGRSKQWFDWLSLVRIASIAVAVVTGPQVSRADEVEFTAEQRTQLVQKVGEIDSMVNRLKALYEENANIAESKRAQCSKVVLDFDEKLVSYRAQRRALDSRGDALLVNMAVYLQRSNSESATVEKLRSDLEVSRNTLAELENNIALLERWWWVPGYGQYLGIKTLVNNEVGQLNAIREEFQDRRLRLANLEQLVNHAGTLICEVKEERERLNSTSNALQCVSEAARKSSEEIRRRTIELLDREEFYRKLNALVSITIEGRQQALADALNSQPSPRILAQIAVRATQLDSALEELNHKQQEGRRFLNAVPDNFCAQEQEENNCTPVSFFSIGSSAWSDGRVSFTERCKDVRIDGAGAVIFASCGSGVRSSVKLRDVHNNDGKLFQVRNGPEMGRNQSSFQQSCRGAFICGSTLTASCMGYNKEFVQTSVELNGIFSLNGNLFAP